MDDERRKHVNATIKAHLPDEGGVYKEVNGKECINLLQVRRLRRLESPIAADDFIKLSDGQPPGERTTSGGWAYLVPKKPMIFQTGSRVRALNNITEDGDEPDPAAEPMGPGWLHAAPGDEGIIEDVAQAKTLDGPTEDAAILVRFDRTGTATLAFAEELELIK